MNYQELVNDIIIARPLQEIFIESYLNAFSELVRKALHVTSVAAEKQYLHEQIVQMQQGKSCFYCIFDRTDNNLIGAIAIRDVHLYKGQLYSWINEKYWGKGYYQQALHLVAREYFRVTHELYFTAQVDVSNIRSYKALKKAGFADWAISEGPYGKQYELLLRKEKVP